MLHRSEADIIAQSIHLQSVGNARELGGYSTADGRKVKHGLLLRTAALNKISHEDITRLTEVYHLAVIADLRMTSEVADDPDKVIAGVKYVNLRVINEESHKELLAQQQAVKGDTLQTLLVVVDSGFMTDELYIEFLADESGKHANCWIFRRENLCCSTVRRARTAQAVPQCSYFPRSALTKIPS